MRKPNAIRILLLLFALTLIISPGMFAQEKPEKKEKELKVVAEDELAPVQAIKDNIKKRLAEPVEKLDLNLIMEGSDFFGTQPSGIRWDSDGSRLWFEWKKWNEEDTGTYQYDVENGSLKRLSKDEAERVPSRRAIWNEKRTMALWTVRDSIMLYRGDTKETVELLANMPGHRPIGFTRDDKTVLFEVMDNAFALSLEPSKQGMLRRLTDIRSGNPPDEEPPTDSQKWLKKQQLALFDVLKRRYDQQEKEKERNESLSIKPLYLQGWRVANLEPSPDLNYIAIQEIKNAPKDRAVEMPSYVTVSGYTESRKIRTKVGDDADSFRLGIIEATTGDVAWTDFGLADRKVTFFGVQWSPGGDRALVQVRSYDNKDRWFIILTPYRTEAEEASETKFDLKAEAVFHEHDDAWINWSVERGNGWLPDGSGIYFLSEMTDKRHIYTVNAEGGEPKALTAGDFVVSSPTLSDDHHYFLYEASLEGNPHENQSFRLPVEGGNPVQLTSGFGRSDATLSPDGSMLASVCSNSTTPWELYVKNVGNTGKGTQVTDSPSPAFKSYHWIDPEIIHFTARDGTSIPAQIYRPANPAPTKPGVVFVHGAGYMQNVLRWWRGSSYGRVYVFQHMLMELGYTVLDIDYRGSAGYGRNWRTAIYQHMGGKDLTDQVDGAKYLVDKYGIDPHRIGIYGGSYGGFITLMAMFLEGDTFSAGAAMRPVTDWAAYNHGYTSDILNTPQDDPDSYLRSSPIYFAEGLKGALLICHGVVDDNVNFQGVVRLVQRLIELRKDNWELAIYPVERHGFVEPASWVDEYRRIVELFDANLKNK